MQLVFATMSDYLKQISQQTSDTLGWRSLRLILAREPSNNVRFVSVEHSTLNLTLSGTARHRTDMDSISDDTPTRPNDIIVMPAGLSGQFSWDSHGDAEQSVVVQLYDDIFVNYCPEVVTPAFLRGHLRPCHYAQRPEVNALVKMLVRELDAPSRRGLLFADSVIRSLALELAHANWTSPSVCAMRCFQKDARLGRAIDLIEAGFASNLSLFDLTAASGLSAGHLIALFKAATGLTPHAYLLERRIRHAHHLLTRTALPLAEIALEAGFSDQSHMTRMFRRRHRATPGSYRRSSG